MRNSVAKGKRLGVILAIALTALLLVTACAPQSAVEEGKVVNLGLFFPLTGAGANQSPPFLQALQDYVRTGRPQNASFDHMFLRHPRRRGYPLSRSVLKGTVRRAYSHCGFPSTWSGTHRLRHTFASRLHQRGVDMKLIADLLGHRRLDSTNLYTQVDLEALRQVARPWPW